MYNYLLVFIGGGLGSMLRFALSRYNALSITPLPAGTMLANLLSSIIIGMVVGFVSSRSHISPSVRVFFAVGFCGGFSTFSTFSFETFYFIKTGQPGYALLNVLGSVVCCVVGVYAGFTLQKLWS